MHKNRIKRLQEVLVEYGSAIKKHEGALTYFESIIPRITHSADEPCVICFDKIESLTVTPCGHLFCRKCILSCITQNASCPTCRNPVRESQLIVVKVSFIRVIHVDVLSPTYLNYCTYSIGVMLETIVDGVGGRGGGDIRELSRLRHQQYR